MLKELWMVNLLNTVFMAIFIWTFSILAIASEQLVDGLIVSGLEQRADDEEAPFDIYSSNKVHNCAGKPSNVYRVYSEYDAVAQRRFLLSLEALKHKMPLTVITDGCEGRALRVHTLRLNR
jgi:hypothetical protein